MSQSELATLAVGSVFHGRYRITRTIKSGGMGAVYEAIDETTASPRALKVMLPSVVEDADQRARFVQEARITGNIDSEHLPRVFDAGIHAPTGEPFIVMDLLRGEELHALLVSRRALPPDEVVTYLSQLARVLEKTHAAGIVHRDIKPANLFITRRDDGSPCLKILDFGIAKVVVGGQAEKTRALGTPLYMAPEQIRGEGGIGPRADLYAVAQVAYTLLAGEAYWFEDSKAHDSLYPMLMALLAGAKEPPSARALRRTGVRLPPGFDAWFQKAASPDPGQRFESATAQVNALADAIRPSEQPAGAPASAEPQPANPPAQVVTQAASPPEQTGPVTADTTTPAEPPTPAAGVVSGPPATPQPASPFEQTAPATPDLPAAPATPANIWGLRPDKPACAPKPPASALAPAAPPTPAAVAAVAPLASATSTTPHGHAPPWLTPVVIGAVAITAIVVVALVVRPSSPASPDSAAAAQSSNPLNCPPGVPLCVASQLPDLAHVDAVEALPEARRLAQRVDSRAVLGAILAVQSVKDGAVNVSSGHGSLMFQFMTPEGAVNVVYQQQNVLVIRGPGSAPEAPDPACSMKAAFNGAVAAGAPTAQPMSLTYQMWPITNTPIWYVTAGNQAFFLDAKTCTMKPNP